MLMRIGFCFNIKRNMPSTDPQVQVDAEFDSPQTIKAIKTALYNGGHQVVEVEANENAYLILHKNRHNIDIVFNIAEGIYGDAREAQIPTFCDILQIPYTHSSALTHAIKLDKALTKKVLLYHGIRTPRFQLLNQIDESLDWNLKFPLLLKPNSEGSSKGIMNNNLVYTKSQLTQRLKWLFNSFREPFIAEEFLPGREFTVSLLGNPPQILPIIEQRLDRLPKKYAPFASYEVKWIWEDTLSDPTRAYDCPAKIDNKLTEEISHISLATFKAINCRDCARVDIRLDAEGNPNILEINTLPGLMPDKMGISYFPIAARTAGYTYDQMVLAILEAARKRYRI